MFSNFKFSLNKKKNKNKNNSNPTNINLQLTHHPLISNTCLEILPYDINNIRKLIRKQLSIIKNLLKQPFKKRLDQKLNNNNLLKKGWTKNSTTTF